MPLFQSKIMTVPLEKKKITYSESENKTYKISLKFLILV